jgi:hypothetical protein
MGSLISTNLINTVERIETLARIYKHKSKYDNNFLLLEQKLKDFQILLKKNDSNSVTEIRNDIFNLLDYAINYLENLEDKNSEKFLELKKML